MTKTIKQFPVLSTIMCCLLVGFASCDKDDEPLNAKEKQISARGWRITDITRPKISDISRDSSIMKVCTSDDRLFFGSDGTNRFFQLQDNVSKCDSTVFFYDNGNWALNGAQDQLQLNGAKRTQKWKILLLNDSIMKVRWRDSLSTSNNILKTISLKNK